MTNELVLYEGEQDVKSLNSLTSESKNIKRITFDFSSHKLLTQNNISHSILENYISEDEKTVIDNFSVELTSNWHKLEIFKKCLEINDINIGFLLEFELLPYFLKIVKKFFGILNILKQEKPKKIFCSSLGNFLKNLIGEKTQLIVVPSKNTDKLFYDSIELQLPYISKIGTINLSRKKFNQIKGITEDLSQLLFRIKPNSAELNKRKNILLLDFNPERYEYLLLELSKLNHNIILLNQRRPAAWNKNSLKIIRKTNTFVINLNNFSNKSEIKKINLLKQSFLKNLQNIPLDNEEITQFFSIQQRTFWNIIKDNFLNLIEARAQEIITKTVLVDSLLNEIPIDLIVEWAHVPAEEKLFLKKAYKNNIPTIFLQHGQYAITRNSLKYKHLQPHIPSLHSKMIVWGEPTKNEIKGIGGDGNRIYALGSTLHDPYFLELKKIQKSKNVQKSKKILIVVSDVSGTNFNGSHCLLYERIEKFTTKIINVIKQTNYIPVIKFRAAQSYHELKPLVLKLDKNIEYFTTEDIKNIILDCDLVISLNFSTVILDAMILNKPTVTILPDEQGYELTPVIKTNSTLSISDIDTLETNLINLFNDETLQSDLIKRGNQFVENYFVHKGNSSNIIARFCDETVDVNK